jgi:hypothetical protein
MDEQVSAQQTRKWPQVFLRTIVSVTVIGGIIGLYAYALHVPRGQDVDRITGFNQPSGLLPPRQKDLGMVLALNYHEYRNNSSRWSLAYFGCLFLSAFSSAMAAFVLKLECFPKRPDVKKDLAALLSTIAAVLITLTTVGNFQQKWQANRLAATAMQNLVYEVWKGDAPEGKSDIYSKIEQINLLRNQEIVGGDSSSQGKDKQSSSEASPLKSQSDGPAKAKQPDNAH